MTRGAIFEAMMGTCEICQSSDATMSVEIPVLRYPGSVVALSVCGECREDTRRLQHVALWTWRNATVEARCGTE